MIKYPSIEQFRNVIRAVQQRHDYQGKDEEGNNTYQHLSPYPTLKFHGTVKLHGTNAGIVKYKDRIEYQSRSRVLSITSDNAGFMLAMSGKNLDFLFEDIEFNEYIAVFGEWCGGNVQGGVALSQLPKMFVVFGVQVDGEWVDVKRGDHSQGIYHIGEFPTFDIDIDFNNPELSQNKLIDMTLAVEECCPVGKHFGVTGIGEGIVFSCVTDPGLRFKSKGEKHSASKVKKLNPVDTETVESLNEFVEYAVTENRLKQGVEYLREHQLPIDQTSTGDFLRWVIGDVVKEEQDTIIKNQIDLKKANGFMSKKARVWYFENI